MHSIDFYGRKLNTYRAALHNHTTNSDGSFTPEELIGRYRELGFDAVAFSDHRTVNRISEYDGRGMTLICGAEMHPDGPRGLFWHMLALGLPEEFPLDNQAPAQEQLSAAVAAGAVVFAAHPYWSLIRSGDIEALKGFSGIEVYNSSCRYIGKEFSMEAWDELLNTGSGRYTALATDDTHTDNEIGHGWTEICAEENTPEALLKALKNGDFYATNGPVIRRLSWENNVFEAEFSEVVDACLVSDLWFGWRDRNETAPQPIHSLRVEIPDLTGKTYLRLQIKDAAGHYAWSNPVFLTK